MVCPAYCPMAAASAGGSALNSGLLVVGKTIFWAVSWVETWLSTNEWLHSSSPPATSSTAARTSPVTDASASNVLLRIVIPPRIWPGRPGPALCRFACFYRGVGGEAMVRGTWPVTGGTSVTSSGAHGPAPGPGAAGDPCAGDPWPGLVGTWCARLRGYCPLRSHWGLAGRLHAG